MPLGAALGLDKPDNFTRIGEPALVVLREDKSFLQFDVEDPATARHQLGFNAKSVLHFCRHTGGFRIIVSLRAVRDANFHGCSSKQSFTDAADSAHRIARGVAVPRDYLRPTVRGILGGAGTCLRHARRRGAVVVPASLRTPPARLPCDSQVQENRMSSLVLPRSLREFVAGCAPRGARKVPARTTRTSLALTLLLLWLPTASATETVDFDQDVAPILASRCSSCHGPATGEGGLRLIDLASATAELDSGARAIVPGNPEQSAVLARVRSSDEFERMPPTGEPLTPGEVAVLERWIEQGAPWPDHWAYRPLNHAVVPAISAPEWRAWPQNVIDRFVLAKMLDRGLKPSPPADKRTLLRRVTIDLTGLPPTPEELDEFLADTSPLAYERVVDRLLASPRYGERWARHWMDLVHFAETHGNDQDRPREHAWPYRDYLIESFNADRPYAEFVKQQIAGDALFPHSPEAIVATGLLAAGPWDESSLRDIQEDSIDREIARYLDRDDIVTTVASTFLSTTVHCARCHDHKFDPISIDEYYSLQAIFAGIDKATRDYDTDPEVSRRRAFIEQLQRELVEADSQASVAGIARLAAKLELGDEQPANVAAWFDDQLTHWEESVTASPTLWHVAVPQSAESTGGATLDTQPDGSVLASGTRPETDIYKLTFHPTLPRLTGLRLDALHDAALPMQGPGRQDNGNFHLNEIQVWVAPLAHPEQARRVPIHYAEADFNQQDWTIEHAIDQNSATAWGIYPEVGRSHWATFQFAEPLEVTEPIELRVELHQTHGAGHLIGRPRISFTSADAPWPVDSQSLPAEVHAALATARGERTNAMRVRLARYFLERRLGEAEAALPPPSKVYCGTNRFEPDKSFRPAPTPRRVHILERGDIQKPLAEARPAALGLLDFLPAELSIPNLDDEGARRAALAEWVADNRNVLTWRSIANRIWQHHFERGLVDTPNDFGRLGAAPSHPELLDWLALELQRNNGSLKSLHRLMVTSATYQQSSASDTERMALDADNRYLWKMPRRRLDAETLRDAMLQVAGSLDLTMGGPSARQFIETPTAHVTPDVDYAAFDVDAAANRRRSVYRFLFRTLPDPFMEALDCPDASQLAPKRTSSITALQALALLNDKVLVRCSQRAADRAAAETADRDEQIRRIVRDIWLREPDEVELSLLGQLADRHGLANVVRTLLNSNEFVFVD